MYVYIYFGIIGVFKKKNFKFDDYNKQYYNL